MGRDLQHVRLRLRRAQVDALREGGEVALARLRGRRQRRQLLRHVEARDGGRLRRRQPRVTRVRPVVEA